MLFKTASYHVEKVLSPVDALRSPGASKRFRKIVAEIKKEMEKSDSNAVAPKSKDFLYFTARSITAMEAANLNSEGEIDGDGHISIDDGNGKCKICNSALETDPEGKKIAGMWHSASGLEPYINDNGDAFPLDELVPPESKSTDKDASTHKDNKKVKGYRTFIGRGLFANHQSDDVEKVRGVILDSYWDSKTLYAVNLVAVDKVAHPQFARDIEGGIIRDVSMGTQVDYSLCSICGNRAVTESDYCDHVRNYKGLRLAGKKVYEINYGLTFIELSAVTTGADRNCKILEKIAMLDNLVVKNRKRIGELGETNHSQEVTNIKSDINTALKQIASLKEEFQNQPKKNTDRVRGIFAELKFPKLANERINKFYSNCTQCDSLAKIASLSPAASYKNDIVENVIVPIYECLNCEAKFQGKQVYQSDGSDLESVLQSFADENTLVRVKNDLLERGIAEAEANNIIDRFTNNVLTKFKKAGLSSKVIKGGNNKMLSRDERLARALKRQAYFQGTVDPNTKKGPEGAEDYTSDSQSEKIRNTQDKQMLQTKSMGGTDGVFPGDAELKSKLQRASKGGKTKMGSDLKTRAQKRRAYFQGTTDPNTKAGEDYKSDPQSEKIRNTQDKQMLQTKSMGGTDGLFPGDAELKKKLQRASLSAKFQKLADRKASKWTIYASIDGQEPTAILTASVDEIFGDQIDNPTGYKKASGEAETNWDWVSSQDYAREVMAAIREQGYHAVVATLKGPEALQKVAQAAPPVPIADPMADPMAGMAPAAPALAGDPAAAAAPEEPMPEEGLIDDEIGEEEAVDTDASAAKLEEKTADLEALAKEISEMAAQLSSEGRATNEEAADVVNIDMGAEAADKNEEELPIDAEAALSEMGIVHYQMKDAQEKLAGASELLRSGKCLKASYKNIKGFKRVVAELLEDVNDVIKEASIAIAKKKKENPFAKDDKKEDDKKDDKKKNKKKNKKKDDKKKDDKSDKEASIEIRKAKREALLQKIAEDSYAKNKELQPAGEAIINEAHPGGGPTVADASGDGGKVETIIEQQNKDLPIATKDPSGKVAASAKQTKVAETAGGATGAPAGGADGAASSYWKQYWGSEGKEPAFAQGLVSDFTKKKAQASTAEVKAKMKRAYDIALNMQKKAMIGSTKEALDAEVENIMQFDDRAFTAFSKAIESVENPTTAASKVQTKTAALNQSIKVGLRKELTDNEFSDLSDIFE